MSVINTGSFAKVFWSGVKAWYDKTYKEYPEEYWKLFDKYSSRKGFEEDVEISSFGLDSQKADVGRRRTQRQSR